MSAVHGLRRLNLRDAAGVFGVSYDFLYQGVRSEELPSIRPSREYLVEPDEVEAFLQRKSAERAEASD